MKSKEVTEEAAWPYVVVSLIFVAFFLPLVVVIGNAWWEFLKWGLSLWGV